jgi:hypothetical protein
MQVSRLFSTWSWLLGVCLSLYKNVFSSCMCVVDVPSSMCIPWVAGKCVLPS